MKAIICTKYGPPEVLSLSEIDRPVPKDNEVLVKIHAAAVTISDCYVRSGKVSLPLWLPMRMYVGFKKPRNPVLGFDLAGEVEEIGKAVKRFRKGDGVFAFSGTKFGAYAEYVCLPEDGAYMPRECVISLKPSSLSFEEAAAVPSRGLLAMQYVKMGKIQRGQKALIYGASGGIGTFAVQMAKHSGAIVTGICGTANLKLVESLGADKVMDYMKEDFLKSEGKYDFILDATPHDRKLRNKIKAQCVRMLAGNGKFLTVDDGHPKANTKDLEFLKELIESGSIKPVIDRTYPLEQAADAHRYVEGGHKKGHVVITVRQ